MNICFEQSISLKELNIENIY